MYEKFEVAKGVNQKS